MEQFLRTSLVLGSEAVEKLKNKRVAVFGIGGVDMLLKPWLEVALELST